MAKRRTQYLGLNQMIMGGPFDVKKSTGTADFDGTVIDTSQQAQQLQTMANALTALSGSATRRSSSLARQLAGKLRMLGRSDLIPEVYTRYGSPNLPTPFRGDIDAYYKRLYGE